MNCKSLTTLRTTKDSNANGNARRPFYKCPNCSAFCTFADNRNVNDSNPLCWCGAYSRGELTGVAKGRRRFYKCSNLQCAFWKWADETNTNSDATPSPPEVKSNEDFWSPTKVERSDDFSSAMKVGRSEDFSSPIKVGRSEDFWSPVKVERREDFWSPMRVERSEDFWPPVKVERSEGFWSPVKVERSEDFCSPIKVERSEVFRSQSAVKAESRQMSRSPSPVRAKSSEVLPSAVEVKYREVSLSPKKETLPLPEKDDFTEGLASLTLNSSQTREPKRSRLHCGWPWIRRRKL